MHMPSEHYCSMCFFLMNLNLIKTNKFKSPGSYNNGIKPIFRILLKLACLFIPYSIENGENEEIGTQFNFDICHNYLKVGRCLNYDNFVINLYVIIN